MMEVVFYVMGGQVTLSSLRRWGVRTYTHWREQIFVNKIVGSDRDLYFRHDAINFNIYRFLLVFSMLAS